MARSWVLFGRGLLLLAASWGASGLRQASGSDLRRILEPSWEPKSMFLGSFFLHVAGALSARVVLPVLRAPVL